MLHYVFQEFTLIVAILEITGNQVKSYNVRKRERKSERKKGRKKREKERKKEREKERKKERKKEREKEREKERKKERKLYLLRVEYINYRWPGSSYNLPQKRGILIKTRNILLILKNPTIS